MVRIHLFRRKVKRGTENIGKILEFQAVGCRNATSSSDKSENRRDFRDSCSPEGVSTVWTSQGKSENCRDFRDKLLDEVETSGFSGTLFIDDAVEFIFCLKIKPELRGCSEKAT